MKVIADIHIHSPYSRATSSRLSPGSLERWAQIKGINLLGTGDCTHPKWLTELRDKLEDSGEGFYRLKESARSAFASGLALTEGLPNPAANDYSPDGYSAPVHFILSGEIATIYKKDGKVRKIHHIVLLPDFKSAAAFNAKLERVGNIHSDGRPILGLDSENLLSMLLETNDRAVLIPAHIWTPWFSVLGARSGFDSLEECYGSLSAGIPAIETGLSSNPPMNWSLSGLDRYSIISNSDAHSPDKLGREATIIEMELSFDSFRKALTTSEKSGSGRSERILGTIEFFPEEGKYHYDGHRNCRVCLAPEEAALKKGICPVCGKPFTRGVLGRVLELADRHVDEKALCPSVCDGNRRPYHSLVPLKEIIAELLETGETSKKVGAVYGALIEKAGSEFSILLDMPLEGIEKLRCPGISGELLAKAVDRMRRGEVFISPGYDGEYGTIRTFAPGEIKESGTGLFKDSDFSDMTFSPDTSWAQKRKSREKASSDLLNDRKTHALTEKADTKKARNDTAAAVFTPDKDQAAVVSSDIKKAIILAGPGTGKTAVLAAKIAGLIHDRFEPSSILALTFTVKAAAELRDRILRVTGNVSAEKESTPRTATFHSLCASILREQYAAAGLPGDFRILGEKERENLLENICKDSAAAGESKQKRAISPKRLGEYIEERKRFLLVPGEGPEDLERILPFAESAFVSEKMKSGDDNSAAELLYREYRNRLRSLGLVDYDGLIAGTARLLALRKDILEFYRKRFRHVFIDEYQDINFAQYALTRILVSPEEDSPSLWVIGDPNQAIYGFRGSDKAFIDRFERDYPEAGRFELRKSFRCAEPIIRAAGRLAGAKLEGVRQNVPAGTGPQPVNIFRREFPTEKSEAEGIARTIASLVGGTSFFAIDSGAAEGSEPWENSAAPGDFAVLLRAAALAEPVVKALKDHGIPFELSGASVWWEEEPLNHLLDYLRKHRAASNLSPSEEIHAAWEALKESGVISEHKNNAASAEAEISAKKEKLLSLAGLFGGVRALLDGLSFERGIPELPREGVKVMTIHASKGLEFDYVFIPGLEEGILPFTLYDRNEDTEEERRLLYVAMTRARRCLWLSGSASRNFRGRILKSAPSRFLSELGNLVPLIEEDRPFKRDPQLSLF